MAESILVAGGTGMLGEPAEANALLGAPTTTLEQWCKLQVRRKLTALVRPGLIFKANRVPMPTSG